MIPMRPRLLAWVLLAQVLAACTGSDTGVEPASRGESDVLGTWRTKVLFGSTTIMAAMEIKADHSITISRTLKGGFAADTSLEYENVREEGTWIIENGLMKATKESCRYIDSTAILAPAPCQAPIKKEVALSISGSQWTIIEGEATYTFVRD